MSLPLLTESEAQALTEKWPTLPEAEKPALRARLAAWRESRSGQPLFPAYEAEQQRRLAAQTETLWLDGPEAWSKATGEKPWWRDQQELDAFKRMSWLAATGTDPDRLREGGTGPARARLAQKWELPDIATDDTAFDAEVQRRLQKDRDRRHLLEGPPGDDEPSAAAREQSLAAFAVAAADTRGGTALDALAKWQAAARHRPGYDPQDPLPQQYAEAVFHARRVEVGTVRPAADAAFSELLKEYKGGGGDLDAAADALLALSPSQRELAFSFIRGDGDRQAAEAGFWEATAKGFGRALAGTVLKGGTSAWRGALMARRGSFQEGTMVRTGGAVQEVTGDLNAEHVARSGMSGAIPLHVWEKRRPLTAAEATAWNASIDAELQRLEVKSALVTLGQNSTAPLTGGSWLRDKIWMPAIESLGSSAVMALPAAWVPGLEMTAQAYRDDEYLRLRDAGMEPGEAFRIAGVTGFAQAVVDKGQVDSLLGKFPGVARTLERVLPSGGKAGRFLKNLAGQAAVQTVSELVQGELLPALFQDVLASQPKFDPAWMQVWKEVAATAGDTALGTLLLSTLSAAGQTARDTRLLDRLTASGAALRAGGFSLPQIAEIQAAPPGERESLLQQHAPAAAPPQGSARETLVQETAALTREEQAADDDALRSLRTEMQEAGVSVVPFERNGTRLFQVTAGQNTTEHATADEAMHAVSERLVSRDDAFLDALGEYVRRAPAGRTLEISGEARSLLDELDAATAAGNHADIHAVWERAEVFRRQSGLDTTAPPLSRDAADPQARHALAGLRVLGKSRTAFAGRVARSVSAIYHGGSIVDLVEEQAENDLREAVGRGDTTLQEMAGALRSVEAATGDRYLHGDTDTAITEGWSSLVRLYATGQRRRTGGNAVTGAVRGHTAVTVREARRRLRRAETRGQLGPGLAAALRDYMAWLKTTLARSARLFKARAEGKLSGDVETLIRRSLALEDHPAAENAGPETGMQATAETGSVTYSIGGHQFSGHDGRGRPLPRLSTEAEERLKEIAGQPLTSSDGLTAALSKNSITKILSGKAMNKSGASLSRYHLAATGLISELFAAGTLKSTGPDTKGDPSVKFIHRVESMAEVDGKPLKVLFTVKEFYNNPDKLLYSMEIAEHTEAEDADAAGVDTLSPEERRRKYFALPPKIEQQLLDRFGSQWGPGYDRYGLPLGPRPVPEGDPLLTPTNRKTEVTVSPDHLLATAGFLSAGDIPRDQLKEALVEYYLSLRSPLPDGASPTVYIFAGGTGAGKSHLRDDLDDRGLLDLSHAVTLDSDDIKEYIPEYTALINRGDSRAAETVQTESNEIMVALRDRLLKSGGGRYDIVHDATLANADASVRLFDKYRKAGYRVQLIGITVDPGQAMARAVMRGEKTGRWVESRNMLETHKNFNNAFDLYVPLADTFMLYNNTGEELQLIGKGVEGITFADASPAAAKVLKERSYFK